MNLRTFIERPVLSAVISITIVVVGIIGLFSLPVEQYPDIAPPTIMVSTTYYGASAETLQKSVIAPLEEAINGVEDMTYMTSSATNAGSVSITVYFKQGTDPDMAAVNVQNRVSRATGQLPAEVTQVGVTTSKRQTSILQMFSLSSPDESYDENFLSNYISINLKPQILRISGVGDMMIMGGEYSMRVWMKPDVMAQYKLIPSDITGVLAEQNIESATGSFGENSNETYQYTMKYKGRLITPEEFGDIVIRSTDHGEVLKLKDIADVQLGQDSYAYHGGMDGHPGVSCMVFQTAGSNATEVNQNIDKFLDEARKDLPKGVELTQMMSSNDFLFASIHEVVKTLIEAIILVILVVYVFLQDFRSTLIPLVGIVVSLVGTFAFIKRADVFHLYDQKKQLKVISQRVCVQILYLLILSCVGYVLFFWQKPGSVNEGVSGTQIFLLFSIAMFGTIWLWSICSVILCTLLGNMWAGIGCLFGIVIGLISKAGSSFFGNLGLFSFSSCELNQLMSESWIYGTLVSFIVGLLLFAVLPMALKKRG